MESKIKWKKYNIKNNNPAEIGVKLVFEGDANGTRSSLFACVGTRQDSSTPAKQLLPLLLLLLHKANSILYHIARRYSCWRCCCVAVAAGFRFSHRFPNQSELLWSQLFTSHFLEKERDVAAGAAWMKQHDSQYAA